MDIDNKNDIDLSHYVTVAEDQARQTNSELFEYPNQNNTEISKQSEKSTNFNYETDENDYSLNSNFVEQTNYEIKTNENGTIRSDSSSDIVPISMQTIEKKVENIEENYAPLNLSARMKVVLASFIVIVCSLMFATIWNFALAAKLNDKMIENQQTISDLKVSIKNLGEEYNVLGDEETIREIAKKLDFVQADDSNTVEISFDEMFEEPTVEEVPSNWFNDVCNFLTSLFS